MRFLRRKRRQPPAIIIVALIDILIVLLIFLMVTTAFKQQQPALKLALPQSNQAQKEGAQESPPLVVAIEKDGSLRLGQEAKPVTPDQLAVNLVSEHSKNPKLKVAIAADEGAPWGRVLKVMDTVKDAGIEGVRAYTREPPKP